MMVTWRARVRRVMEEISHKIYECHFLAISWNMNYWNHKNAERRGSGQNVDDRFWQEDVHSTVIGVVWQQHHLWTNLPPSGCCSLLPHHNRCSTWTLVLRSHCMLATVRLVWNLLLFSWQKIRPHQHFNSLLFLACTSGYKSKKGEKPQVKKPSRFSEKADIFPFTKKLKKQIKSQKCRKRDQM